MAVSIAAPAAAPRSRSRDFAFPHPLASIRFDWLVVATSAWFIAGLFLDGWAHNTIPSLETFFTPWHAVLYSGFLASLAVLGWGIGRNRARGLSVWQAVPAGYELSLIGGVLFVVSGFADMLWHIAFGIEANIDALLSPTHLLLLLGGTLFITGPIRSFSRRHAQYQNAATWFELMPRILALTYVLAALAFFTQYADPWGGPWLASPYQPVTNQVRTAGGGPLPTWMLEQGLNVAGVLLQSALIAGVSVVALRSARIPAGGFTLIIGLSGVLTILMRQKYELGIVPALLVATVLAGAVADLVYARAREALTRPWALQAFVALIPALSTAALITAVAATRGTWWTIHLWAGAVVLSAAVGWLIALLGVAQREQQQREA